MACQEEQGNSSRQAQGWMLLIAVLFLWLLVQRIPSYFANQSELMVPKYQMDINTADFADLLNLPEVGPSLAKNILKHRNQYGPFDQLSDMAAVSGVGPKTLTRLSPYLAFPSSENDLVKQAMDAESLLTASGPVQTSSH